MQKHLEDCPISISPPSTALTHNTQEAGDIIRAQATTAVRRNFLHQLDVTRRVGGGPSLVNSKLVEFAQGLQPPVYGGWHMFSRVLQVVTVGLDIRRVQRKGSIRRRIDQLAGPSRIVAPSQEGPEVCLIVKHRGRCERPTSEMPFELLQQTVAVNRPYLNSEDQSNIIFISIFLSNLTSLLATQFAAA